MNDRRSFIGKLIAGIGAGTVVAVDGFAHERIALPAGLSPVGPTVSYDNDALYVTIGDELVTIPHGRISTARRAWIAAGGERIKR